MNDRELLAAAELARRNGIWDRAINTADKTVSLHDFGMRYPAPYGKVLSEQARIRQIDEPWVLGLVRQESRFIADARSSAGASGLMQLLPATARWVAQKIGMKGYHSSRVNQPRVNVALGTFYLRHVLDGLGRQPGARRRRLQRRSGPCAQMAAPRDRLKVRSISSRSPLRRRVNTSRR